MGNGLLVQYRQFSYFNLAVHLKWLGWFGVVHGFAEWAHMFSIIGPESIISEPSWLIIEPSLQTISFIFLMLFATQLYTHTTKKSHWLTYAPLILLLLWLWGIILGIGSIGLIPSIHLSMILTRYFICFPGSLLAAYSFILQSRELREKEFHGETKYIYGVALAFTLYAFFAGLVTRENGFLLSQYINYKFIENWTHVPVPVFRALCGVMIAYFTIKVMSIFNLEYSTRLANAERDKMLMQERERISRDLHDGIIQTLYGIGLVLENCLYLLKEQDALEQIKFAMKKLNGSIQDIRWFILSLKSPQFTTLSFPQLITSQLQFFSKATGLRINTSEQSLSCLDYLSPEAREHLYHIIQEVLANIAKHANASQIQISCSACATDNSCIEIKIEDNGLGVDNTEIKTYQGSGLGLRNITKRSELLGAAWNWSSKPDGGSLFAIVINKKEIKHDNKDNHR